MKRFFKMSSLEKILENNNLVAETLKTLKQELEVVKRELINQKKQQLIKENASLAQRVDKLKIELISLEQQNGKKQIPIPGEKQINIMPSAVTAVTSTKPLTQEEISSSVPAAVKENQSKPTKPEKEKKPKKEKPAGVPKGIATGGDDAKDDIHVGLLDMRIGKIVEISQHPDADSLYLEKIDCGEPAPRTVISGLVKFVPIDEMRNRLVVVLCNLKPAKMRGIVSEAMVMCASTSDKVEVLNPPENCIPGDLVHCENYERIPPAQLNPKKKIFETVAVDLKTNSDLIACYKDKPLFVPNKGNIMAKTLQNVQIK